ncbi:MAG: hypothetical protein JNL98_27065 [Bryobacterales bacterium]|nr:hypothetical protein [Bryobacterales bacterium]
MKLLRNRWTAPLLAVIFTVPISLTYGIHARFATDDMMNMGRYLSDGLPAIASHVLKFFSGYYRPMGGLYYMILYPIYGLDPTPYRIAIHAILAANVLLACWVGRLISRSYLAAFVCAVVTGYHSSFFNLHYDTSVVYDVLCFAFYLAALGVYLQGRQSTRQPLTWKQSSAVLVLFICALDSKEMAISLPLVIAGIETANALRGRNRVAALAAWFAACRPLLVAMGLVSLAYISGKLIGPGALGQTSGYVPVVSLSRWWESSTHQFAELLFLTGPLTETGRAICVLGPVAAALIARRHRAPVGVLLMLLSLLPVAFIRPIRGGANLYVPLFGFGLFVGCLSVDILSRLTNTLCRRDRAAIMNLVLFLGSLVYAHAMFTSRSQAGPAWERSHDLTWSMIQQVSRMRDCGLKSGHRILFLRDPFEGWDMYFIAQLVLRDRKPVITLGNKLDAPLRTDEIARLDHVFDVSNGALRAIKGSCKNDEPSP